MDSEPGRRGQSQMCLTYAVPIELGGISVIQLINPKIYYVRLFCPPPSPSPSPPRPPRAASQRWVATTMRRWRTLSRRRKRGLVVLVPDPWCEAPLWGRQRPPPSDSEDVVQTSEADFGFGLGRCCALLSQTAGSESEESLIFISFGVALC